MAEQIERDYEIDRISHGYCRRLIERYPEEFDFINPADILVVRNIAREHSRYYAATSLIPKTLWPILDFRILIQNNAYNYGVLPENAQVMVMYHELKHIVPGEPYKLVRHDLEDHSFMVNALGINWPERNDLPNIFDNDIHFVFREA